jgi:hypothetical protein
MVCGLEKWCDVMLCDELQMEGAASFGRLAMRKLGLTVTIPSVGRRAVGSHGFS